MLTYVEINKYGVTNDPDMVPRLMQLFGVLAGRVSPTRRLDVHLVSRCEIFVGRVVPYVVGEHLQVSTRTPGHVVRQLNTGKAPLHDGTPGC